MLKIRLTRRGKKRQPFYRVVVANVESKRDGRYVEQVGYYNPMKDPIEYLLKEDRVLHWLSVGAQPTDAVKRLLVKQGTYDRLERVRAGEEIDALFAEFEGREWPPVEGGVETESVETPETPEPVVEVVAEAPAAPVVEEVVAEVVEEPVAEVVAPVVEEPVAEVAKVVEETPAAVEPEPEPAAEVVAEPKTVVKKAKPTKYKAGEGEDDLTKIEGIGPKIAATLQAAGVRTYLDLAGSSATQLKDIVSGAGISASPNTWPTQATFAATGDWDELANLQSKLKGGR